MVASSSRVRGQNITTWNVPGDGTNTCTTADPSCSTIQAAINASSSGGTIQIAAGTFFENLTITNTNIVENLGNVDAGSVSLQMAIPDFLGLNVDPTLPPLFASPPFPIFISSVPAGGVMTIPFRLTVPTQPPKNQAQVVVEGVPCPSPANTNEVQSSLLLQLAEISQEIYNPTKFGKVPFGGVTYTFLRSGGITGLYMEEWKAPDGNIVIAFRGTANPWTNVAADAGYSGIDNRALPLTAELLDYVDQATPFVNVALKDLPSGKTKTIIFTGHSLGGGLAMLFGHATGFPTVAFNGPGVGFVLNDAEQRMQKNHLAQPNPNPGDTSNIINVVISSDPVHLLPLPSAQIGQQATLPDPSDSYLAEIIAGGIVEGDIPLSGILVSLIKKLIAQHSIATVVHQLQSSGTITFTPPGCTDLSGSVQRLYPLVKSIDPNDKAGSQGAGPQHYISGTQALPYTVFFQNLATATAPAQKVVITDQLDPNVDLSTFSLGPISFGNQTVVPPPGLSSYSTAVDLRPATNLIVDISASLNSGTWVATWTYQSIDPATGLPPTDPLVGFLPPDVNPPEGEGSVLFTVMPKSGLSTGTTIQNQATVVFDVNPPIATQTWVNTIDNTPPTSQVSALPATESSSSFQVQWSGSDVGSGIQDFSIYVSDNGGAFSPWQLDTTANSATFTGQVGHTYGFYSIARDLAGNVETPKTTAEATTMVTVSSPPTPSPGPLKGDINGDGKVDLQDIILIADYLTGKQDLTPAQQAAADVNGDGKIDIFDIIDIARFLAGIVSQLGVERTQPYNLALARPLKVKSEMKNLTPGEIATVRLLAGSDLLGVQVGPQGRLSWDPKVVHIREIRGVEPYRILATNIDNQKGEARFVVLDMSKALGPGDAMLELVLDATGTSGASTFLRFTVDMAIDRKGQPVNLKMEPVPVVIGPPVPLAVREIKAFPTPVTRAGSVQFMVEGRAIRGLQVEVYDLDGRRVFASPEVVGENRLSWNLLNDQGQRIANGVYLYVVTVRGFNGEIFHSGVQKLVVLR